MSNLDAEHVPYAQIMAARPPTLYGLADSPIDLAAFAIDRSWAERAYPRNLIHYNRLDRGGHFTAWEQPELLLEEMRASFRSLRN